MRITPSGREVNGMLRATLAHMGAPKLGIVPWVLRLQFRSGFTYSAALFSATTCVLEKRLACRFQGPIDNARQKADILNKYIGGRVKMGKVTNIQLQLQRIGTYLVKAEKGKQLSKRDLKIALDAFWTIIACHYPQPPVSCGEGRPNHRKR
jgi:hypothetical protein